MAPGTPYRANWRPSTFGDSIEVLRSPTKKAAAAAARFEDLGDDSWEFQDELETDRQPRVAQHIDFSQHLQPEQQDIPEEDEPEYLGEEQPSNLVLGEEVEAYATRLEQCIQTRLDPKLESYPEDLLQYFQEITASNSQNLERLLDDFAERTGRDPREEDIWTDEAAYAELMEGMTEDPRDLLEAREAFEFEMRTWSLLTALPDALQSNDDDDMYDTPKLPARLEGVAQSNKKIFQFFKENDPRIRRLMAILHWLMQFAPPPDASVVREGIWAFSKTEIKYRKRNNNMRGIGLKTKSLFGGKGITSYWGQPAQEEESTYVSELDPDAPLRQNKELASEDIIAEDELLRTVYQHLRAQDLAGAIQACRDAGEYWRGQTLLGNWETYDLPDDENSMDVDGAGDDDGANRRELWRQMCYNLARSPKVGMWEQAVYGLLCGDIFTVIPVCQTWEDHLFAHINSLLESCFSHFLLDIGQLPPKFGKFQIYDFLQQNGHDINHLPRIIDTLRNKKVVGDIASNPQRVIQGALIAGTFYELVVDLARQWKRMLASATYDPANDEDAKGLSIVSTWDLRTVVHILAYGSLYSGTLGPNEDAVRAAEIVIAAYINMLIDAGKQDLAPLYAGLLSTEKSVSTMAAHLLKIETEKERRSFINQLEIHRINVADVIQNAMAKVVEETKPIYVTTGIPRRTGLLGKKTTGIKDDSKIIISDSRLIDTLEWMLLVEGMEDEIATAGCTIAERFLLTGRLSAARDLFVRVPTHIVIPATATIQPSDAIEETLYKPLYVQFETFINAVLTLESWKEAINRRVKYSKIHLEAIFQKVEDQIKPVLESWLDIFPEDSTPPSTIEILRTLRQIYLPDLAIAMHQVYMDAGRLLNPAHYQRAMDLANLVAGETNCAVLKAMKDANRLPEYLRMVDEAAAIMDREAEI
ncbi:hypothetical protein BJ508DRAFT_416820 [Ascobolus immersus RN42]|uniref:Nuclear pore complex protein n=1 Tax=Ascobolus immersus RN42 TaxID=1160509 RepID=A0A3N4HW54_ASCIM|nr:hypothetical protein BJ508DRAFT_416820 [Ascobolus immersus RN42]